MTGSEARPENNVNLDFPRLARQLQVERDFLRTILATYAVMGSLLFGRDMEDFATLERSIVTCFRALICTSQPPGAPLMAANCS